MKTNPQSKNNGLPMALNIEPTTACNLGCQECPSGLKSFTRPTGKLSVQQHEEWLKEIAKTVFFINYYFQGEPFLHPQFLDLIRAATKHKIYTTTSTNAHFISTEKANEIVKSGLKRLIISIDGTTQKSYEAYRVNGKLETVIDGAKEMVAAKKRANSKTPYLIFQFLVVGANEHQINEIQKLSTEIGVDELKLKSAQIYDYENGSDLIPKNEKYARYTRMTNGKYRLKFELKDECWRMWSSSVLTWDGNVVPCCFDKDASHKFGNINDESLQNIWKNQDYSHFRKQVFTDRQSIEICRNCTEGAEVYS